MRILFYGLITGLASVPIYAMESSCSAPHYQLCCQIEEAEAHLDMIAETIMSLLAITNQNYWHATQDGLDVLKPLIHHLLSLIETKKNHVQLNHDSQIIVTFFTKLEGYLHNLLYCHPEDLNQENLKFKDLHHAWQNVQQIMQRLDQSPACDQ